LTLLKDSRIASLICAVIVLLSLLIGVQRSASRRAEKLNEMLYSGVDGSGYGIRGDLSDRMDDAGILLKIAAKYEGAETESARLEEALLALQSSSDASAGVLFRLDSDLEDAFESLDLRLQELPLGEKDEDYRAQYKADFESRGITMMREAAAYNTEVRAYEEKVGSGLLVRLFGWLLPLPEVEAFQ